MSNSNYEKIQNYLDLCDHKVISAALREGLDVECYHRYLQEMYFAIPKDHSYRTVYECSIYGVSDAATEHVDLSKPSLWAFSYGEVFMKQLSMLMKLMEKIEQHCGDEALRTICLAQLRFAKQLLLQQRRILDTILVWSPSKTLLECKTDSSREYADVLETFKEVNNKLQSLVEKLK